MLPSGLLCVLQLPLPKKQIKTRFKGEKERGREHYKSGKEDENQIVERERERNGGWWWWRIWEAMMVVTMADGKDGNGGGDEWMSGVGGDEWMSGVGGDEQKERWWWWWWRAEGEMVVVVRRSNMMDWTRRGVRERERDLCVRLRK